MGFMSDAPSGINDNMTSNYAKAHSNSCEPLNVLFVIYPDIVLLDLSGPLQVFTHAKREPNAAQAYQTHIASLSGGMVETNSIVKVESATLKVWLDQEAAPLLHTLVIVGGDGVYEMEKDAKFVEQIRTLANRAKRVCSVCSGAIILAATGILDGRRAVTHWEDCDYLADHYPAVTVDVDPIYIKDGTVWTSAGITAGIDMALAIIEEDLGKSAAIDMARSLVTPIVRSGGQSQFSPALEQQARDSAGRFSDLHNWIADNLEAIISVDDMAQRCNMSSRNFSRRYTHEMGVSPAKALESMRVDAARSLLTDSDLSIKTIAARCGFMDDERMRRAFLRHIKTSPSAYRAQFRPSA